MTVEQRFTFDEIGECYDRYRPGYPQALFDDLVSISGVSPADRLLEVGCGTGQATRPLAQRGFAMLCIEPGPRLAELSRKNLEAFPGVEVRSQTFEDWPCQAAAFGLVFSAQAFHWLSPEIRFAKSAEALRSEGSLAIFGNSVCVDRSAHGDAGGPLSDRLDAAYAEWAPSLAGPPATGWYGEDGPIPELVAESGFFEAVVAYRYPWAQRYSTDEYLGLLGTHSGHRLLAAGQREGLYRAIGHALEACGREIEIFYQAHLYVARRKACARSERAMGDR